MVQHTVYPIWFIGLAFIAAMVFIFVWMPFNRKRTRSLNRLGSQQPSEQQPKEIYPNLKTGLKAEKIFYIGGIFSIAFLIYFYCCLESTPDTLIAWDWAVGYLVLLPFYKKLKDPRAAYLLVVSVLVLLSVGIPALIHHDSSSNKILILCGIIAIVYTPRLIFDLAKPQSNKEMPLTPKNREKQLSNWVVVPVVFVMCIVLAFIAWFVIGMALQGRLGE